MSAPDTTWTVEARAALALVREACDENTTFTAWAALSDAARVAWACGNDEARDLLDQARRWMAAGERERVESYVCRALRLAEAVTA